MIRVFVADDQELVRSGLRSLLDLVEDVAVVGEAGSGRDALSGLARLAEDGEPADVLLLDVRMPGMSGLDVLRELGEGLPHTIIVTTFPDDEALVTALKLGARGFLLKDSTLDELCEAIRAVAAGESAVQPVTLSRILPGLRDVSAPSDAMAMAMAAPLTAREKEIVRLLAAGLSNREIAEALRNAEGTIKNHISNILQKLGARDRTQAVLRALQSGLL